jgi:hypothetical protein
MTADKKQSRREADEEEAPNRNLPSSGFPVLRHNPENAFPGERETFIRQLTPARRIDVDALHQPFDPDASAAALLQGEASLDEAESLLTLESYQSLPSVEQWPDLYDGELPKNTKAELPESDLSDLLDDHFDAPLRASLENETPAPNDKD